MHHPVGYTFMTANYWADWEVRPTLLANDVNCLCVIP